VGNVKFVRHASSAGGCQARKQCGCEGTESGSARSRVAVLRSESRIEEIARMLGGVAIICDDAQARGEMLACVILRSVDVSRSRRKGMNAANRQGRKPNRSARRDCGRSRGGRMLQSISTRGEKDMLTSSPARGMISALSAYKREAAPIQGSRQARTKARPGREPNAQGRAYGLPCFRAVSTSFLSNVVSNPCRTATFADRSVGAVDFTRYCFVGLCGWDRSLDPHFQARSSLARAHLDIG